MLTSSLVVRNNNGWMQLHKIGPWWFRLDRCRPNNRWVPWCRPDNRWMPCQFIRPWRWRLQWCRPNNGWLPWYRPNNGWMPCHCIHSRLMWSATGCLCRWIDEHTNNEQQRYSETYIIVLGHLKCCDVKEVFEVAIYIYITWTTHIINKKISNQYDKECFFFIGNFNRP